MATSGIPANLWGQESGEVHTSRFRVSIDVNTNQKL